MDPDRNCGNKYPAHIFHGYIIHNVVCFVSICLRLQGKFTQSTRAYRVSTWEPWWVSIRLVSFSGFRVTLLDVDVNMNVGRGEFY